VGRSAGAGGRRRLYVAPVAGASGRWPGSGGPVAGASGRWLGSGGPVAGAGRRRAEAEAARYIDASSVGATSFLRLITPGSSIWLSCAGTPNARATPVTSPATRRSVPLVNTSVTISA
jgi:hypothetical protein